MRSIAVPPLVAEPAELSTDQRRRYARHLRLRGVDGSGQGRLLGARVAVVGAGGLGVPIVRYLAAAGVGNITVIDDDVVDHTNLHRQVAYRDEHCGEPKATVLAAQIDQAYPDTRIVPVPQRLTADNATALLAHHHLVLDGTDNFATRDLIDRTCAGMEAPVVWGAIHAWYGQVAVLWQVPASVDAPSIRMADVVDPAAATESNLSCTTDGVMGPLCGQVGSLMALEAVKLITGAGQPLIGRTMLIDAWSAQSTVLELQPRAVDDAGATEVGGRTDARVATQDRRRSSAVAASHTDTPGRDDGSVNVMQVLSDDAHASDVSWRVIDMRLDRSEPLPNAEPLDVGDLLIQDPTEQALLLICHNGSRARDAVPALRSRGHRAYYLAGGYLAWSHA